MNDEKSRHLADETMAAFVEGTLSPAERMIAARHLADCSDCRIIVAEGARFEAEEASGKPRMWWLAIAAAVVLAVVIAIPLIRRRSETPIESLVAAAPHSHRNVDARLSGFGWAPLQAPTRGKGVANPEDLKLDGAAGSVLESKDTHAIGVAYLLIDRRSESIDTLERAAESSNDAAVWNDLAAARLATAVRDEHAAQLPLALAAADHALRLDPRSAPALFNRALILEHLGLSDAARRAWQKYLNIDPSSDWSAEARAHLAKLSEHGEVFDPKLLRTATGAQLEAIVRRFPQDSRMRAEGPFLTEWGTKRSDELLAQTRAVGAALGAFHGEWLLADAVTAIDRADDKTRDTLAEGYRVYGEARQAYAARRVAESEPLFERAVELFGSARSPMADMAAYYAGECQFDLNRGVGKLATLRAKVDRVRHRALTAQIEAELAVGSLAAGDPSAAVRHGDIASEIFRTLGESAHAGAVDSPTAVALAARGDTDRAWSRFVRAFSQLRLPASASRRSNVLQSSAVTLAWGDQRDAAASILTVTLEENGEMSPYSRALAFAQLARIRSAENPLRNARKALASISDPTLRNTASSEVDLADAVVHSGRSPHGFDAPISFMASYGLNNLLPDALLQRARVSRAAGDDHAALRDCVAAQASLEQRAAGADLSADDTAEQIAAEMVEIDLRRGDAPSALAVVDPGYRRVSSFPKHAALVEYVCLPDSVVVFSCIGDRLEANRVAIARSKLRGLVETLTDELRRRAAPRDIVKTAGRLHAYLLAPIQNRLAGAGEIDFVTDRYTRNIPFAALYDSRRGRYLIEDFTIRLSESAALDHETRQDGSAVVIGNPSAAGERLQGSAAEAHEIAQLYGARTLEGAEATRDNFVAAVREAAVIHYSGHAENGALMLATTASDDGLLEAGEVAHLTLLRRPIVILAACNTFRDLAHAFLTAHARGVVGTLWDIDDDVSADLFSGFHRRLHGAAPPEIALREAQLAFLRSTDPHRSHPASWASVELISSATDFSEDRS